MSSQNINYAKYLGVESVAAAVIFAIAYTPLFIWFILQSIKRLTYVWQIANGPSDHGVLRLMKNRMLFRMILLAAVIFGVIGATKADSSNPENGKQYKIASTVIFLVLSVLIAVQTLRLTVFERKSPYITPLV
ncbi:hypothetical protein C0991_011738 [Blastosporella zonata]|nr:hypothetical protein C0991_011738 [Blastosporella zonata]